MFVFRVLVLVLLAFFVLFAHSLLTQPITLTQSITAVNSQPASVSPLVVTNGWMINRFVLNNLGTVAFSSGQTASSDGLVLVRSNQFIKFAAAGDPVPGTTGKIFISFSSGDNPTGSISLNDRDEVAFTAGFAQCPSVTQFYTSSCSASWDMGVFLYSGGVISEITTGYVSQVWLNNNGQILFTDAGTFFVYSQGQLTKVVPPFGALSYATVVFNDAGVITLADPNLGIFHSSGTTFIKDVGRGDPGPDGIAFGGMWPVAANGEGDIAFVSCSAACGPQSLQQSIFLRRRDGTIVRIMTDGDPSPLGGTFSLTYTEYNRGGPYAASALVAPQINKSGSVVFAAPVKGATASGGLFLYTADGLKVIAANGDSGPPQTNANFVFFSSPPNSTPAIVTTVGYAINDFDTVTFRSVLSNGSWGVFQRVGDSSRKLAVWGDVVPGAPGSSFGNNSQFYPLLQNDFGDVAFFSYLCCGSSEEGLFLSPAPGIQPPNGDFELPGASALPANWETVWTNSGSGEAFRYGDSGANPMRGTSVLRLHVDSGGSSIFVLSDAIPVSADTIYTITSWMRYDLISPNDAVLFSVIQFDAAANVVGFNEVSGAPGENFWLWKPKRLLIHTAPTTASVEIRYGLMSAGESYLDVDAVQ